MTRPEFASIWTSASMTRVLNKPSVWDGRYLAARHRILRKSALSCFVIARCKDHHVIWYTIIPTMHRLILQLPHLKVMPPQLRFIRCSSSLLPPPLFRDIESKFGTPVVDSYGLTETSSFCTFNPESPSSQLPGSVGIPQGPKFFIRDRTGASLDAVSKERSICGVTTERNGISTTLMQMPLYSRRTGSSALVISAIWMPTTISSSHLVLENLSTNEVKDLARSS